MTEFDQSLKTLESALSQARDPRFRFGVSVVYLGNVRLRICSNFIEAERYSATHDYNRITDMLTEVCGMAEDQVYDGNKSTYKVLGLNRAECISQLLRIHNDLAPEQTARLSPGVFTRALDRNSSEYQVGDFPSFYLSEYVVGGMKATIMQEFIIRNLERLIEMLQGSHVQQFNYKKTLVCVL